MKQWIIRIWEFLFPNKPRICQICDIEMDCYGDDIYGGPFTYVCPKCNKREQDLY
jgi:hypothetical protein